MKLCTLTVYCSVCGDLIGVVENSPAEGQIGVAARSRLHYVAFCKGDLEREPRDRHSSCLDPLLHLPDVCMARYPGFADPVNFNIRIETIPQGPVAVETAVPRSAR